jgi:hypothetical protein
VSRFVLGPTVVVIANDTNADASFADNRGVGHVYAMP